MTKQEIESKRELIAKEYVNVVIAVLNAENAILKNGESLLQRAKSLPEGEERARLCMEYNMMISREIISKMSDQDVIDYQL